MTRLYSSFAFSEESTQRFVLFSMSVPPISIQVSLLRLYSSMKLRIAVPKVMSRSGLGNLTLRSMRSQLALWSLLTFSSFIPLCFQKYRQIAFTLLWSSRSHRQSLVCCSLYIASSYWPLSVCPLLSKLIRIFAFCASSSSAWLCHVVSISFIH